MCSYSCSCSSCSVQTGSWTRKRKQRKQQNENAGFEVFPMHSSTHLLQACHACQLSTSNRVRRGRAQGRNPFAGRVVHHRRRHRRQRWRAGERVGERKRSSRLARAAEQIQMQMDSTMTANMANTHSARSLSRLSRAKRTRPSLAHSIKIKLHRQYFIRLPCAFLVAPYPPTSKVSKSKLHLGYSHHRRNTHPR